MSRSTSSSEKTIAAPKVACAAVPHANERRKIVVARFRHLVPVLLAMVSCGKEPASPTVAIQPVKMMTIGETGSAAVREYPGTISAAQRADLAFEVPGQMIEFPVSEGEAVARGAVLGRLDARDYQARLDSARAVLRKAQADYRRSSNLYSEDPGAIALTRLDADKRGVEVAEARAREAEKAYEDTILRAPFDGVVARKLVDDFANVQAKQPIVVLQDTSHLEMVVNVPERDFVSGPRATPSLDALSERLQPRVVVSSLPKRQFPARLKEIATVADPVTRTFAVTFRFPTPEDVNIMPGMTAKIVVRADGNTTDRILIPVHAATAAGDGQASVWLIDPGSMTVTRRPVELGNMQGDQVEVRSGLAAGEVVAVSGVALLRDGMRVRRFDR